MALLFLNSSRVKCRGASWLSVLSSSVRLRIIGREFPENHWASALYSQRLPIPALTAGSCRQHCLVLAAACLCPTIFHQSALSNNLSTPNLTHFPTPSRGELPLIVKRTGPNAKLDISLKVICWLSTSHHQPHHWNRANDTWPTLQLRGLNEQACVKRLCCDTLCRMTVTWIRREFEHLLRFQWDH